MCILRKCRTYGLFCSTSMASAGPSDSRHTRSQESPRLGPIARPGTLPAHRRESPPAASGCEDRNHPDNPDTSSEISYLTAVVQPKSMPFVILQDSVARNPCLSFAAQRKHRQPQMPRQDAINPIDAGHASDAGGPKPGCSSPNGNGTHPWRLQLNAGNVYL